MTDTKSLSKLQLLHPAVRQSAITAYNEAVRLTPKEVHPIITSTFRTFAEQANLYNQGRTTPGQIFTQAKPGQGYHSYGLALDFALVVKGRLIWDEKHPSWIIVVTCFVSEGWEWGGHWDGFKDYPHFQKRLKNWKELQKLHNAGKFIPADTFLDL